MKPGIVLFVITATFSLVACANQPTLITLENQELTVRVTPSFGGRVLHAGLNGQDNVLLVGAAAEQAPSDPIDIDTPYTPYLGHTVWLGPQSEWWVHQDVLAGRKQARMPWPPDPYITASDAEVIHRDQQRLTLELPASPVTGIQLQKTVALNDSQPNAVDLQVTATNVRSEPVAWDIWFNTRVPASSQVYVPVDAENNVRLLDMAKEGEVPLAYHLADGMFSLNHVQPDQARGRQGKAFIQPAAGWLAAFSDDQLFIIAFPWHREDAIHPEQGQVEIYTHYRFGERADGVMELEVHAPYRHLMPGEAMEAQERWYLLPYTGSAERGAQLKFLKESLQSLGVTQ